MPSKLIIGYGNPLRSDDGIGWRVAGEIARQLPNSEFEVVQCHQLMPELAEKISRAELVIFVDAVHGERPGHWACQEIVPEIAKGTFSHSVSPARLLALARELYGSAPRACLFTMCGESFDHGDRLSKLVESRLAGLMSEIRDRAMRTGN